MSSAPDLRASDAERDETVALLREHAGDGRLTMDELDERCSAALAARTRGELAALLRDLPRPPQPAPGPSAPVAPVPAARGLGVRPFTYEQQLRVAPHVAMDEALRHLAPALHHGRYELVDKQPGRLGFSYSRRPAWTIAVAILGFPIGLVALLHKQEERVTLDFDATPAGDTRLVVSGRAPRSVRRAFAELLAS